MIGYKYRVVSNVRWRYIQGGVLPLSPPGTLSDVSEKSVNKVLESGGGEFIRWEANFDQATNSNWWHVIKDTPESIDELPKKTRYMIRKASKRYDARPIDVSDILAKGHSVYMKAYQRYNTHERMFNKEEFCKSVRELPEQTEWWGVFDCKSEDLVAFSENYVDNSTCFYVTMWLDPVAMANFAGYLLFHRMELHYLEDRGFRYVSDGARSLSHDTNIHDFLIRKFNFRKAYAQLRVVYSPWLRLSVVTAYPFRNLIRMISWPPFKKAFILLKQEEIRRSCLRSVK